MLSGLAPALSESKAEVVSALKADARGGPERQRLRNAFVVGQVAFSIVLVVGAGLFVRALQRATEINPGFDPRGVELAALDLSLAGYTADTGRVFARELIQRVRDCPVCSRRRWRRWCRSAAAASASAASPCPAYSRQTGARSFDADWNVVTPGYFAAMKMTLVSGRDFTDADREGSAVRRDRERNGRAPMVAQSGCRRKDSAAAEGRPGTPGRCHERST